MTTVAEHRSSLTRNGLRLTAAYAVRQISATGAPLPTDDALCALLDDRATPSAQTYFFICRGDTDFDTWLRSDIALWQWLDGEIDDDAFNTITDSLTDRRQLAVAACIAIGHTDGKLDEAARDLLQSAIDQALPIPFVVQQLAHT